MSKVPSTPRGTEIVSARGRIEQALEHVKALCDYAYETGFHELGYDPVEELRSALSQSRPSIPCDPCKTKAECVTLDECVRRGPREETPSSTRRVEVELTTHAALDLLATAFKENHYPGHAAALLDRKGFIEDKPLVKILGPVASARGEINVGRGFCPECGRPTHASGSCPG